MEAKLTPANGILIGLNSLVMVICILLGPEIESLIYSFGVMDWTMIINKGEYYRLFTSMFLHFGFEHYLQNMIFLFFVGCFLETAMGSVKYFIFYIVAGLGAGVCSLVYDTVTAANVISAGASGAIFAVVGGLLWVIVRNKGRYKGIGLPGMLLMIVGSLYYGFTSTDVDNVAHVGGVLCGFLLAVVFYRKKERQLSLTKF